MALALGTNVGFVATAPSTDPAGGDTTIDGSSVVVKDTSPSTAVKITQIGWYRGSGTDTANFEIALYSDSAGVADARLYVDNTNSSSSSGWITVTVDWAISPSTAYWLGLQMDAHTGSSTVDSATSGGSGTDVRTSQTTLNNPYGGGAVADADGMYAIYALYQTAPTVTLNSPADASSDSDTTPTLDFTGTDAQGNDIRYQLQISSTPLNNNNAILFDGSTQYGKINNFSGLDGLQNVTIEGWFYNDPASGAYAVAACIANAVEDDVRINTENGTGNTGTNFGVRYSGTDADGYQSTGIFDTNTWVHYALVGTLNGQTKIYKNGTEISYTARNSPTGTLEDTTGDFFLLASNQLAWDADWKGKIGGFIRVWNVARTGTEINNNKSVHISGNANCIINLRFDEGSGTTIDNEGTSGADMTLYNSPSWTTGPVITDANTLLNEISGTDAGFANPDVGGDTDPFTSGDNIQFTVQSALAAGTYYWRVRAIDPSGSNSWGAWSSTRSFDITAGGGTLVKDIISGFIPFAR